MRRNINGSCSSSCCSNPNIRTINTMGADTQGNFEIRAGAGVGITTETNGIRIAYIGGITTYDNTDGNIVIDNANFTIDLANDIAITGDMVIAGDLTVNGTYYTVHAEHVYTEDDYIIMRDGAVTGLGSGDFSGFQVKLYDGVNDGRLVIDNSGTARVGDVGDEQPLLTREESAQLNNGDLLQWNGTSQKAVSSGVNTSQIVRGSGNIGDDTKPIKVINGVATAVTNELQTKLTASETSVGNNCYMARYGQIILINMVGYSSGAAGPRTVLTGLPRCISQSTSHANDGNGSYNGELWIATGGTTMQYRPLISNSACYSTLVYITDQ